MKKIVLFISICCLVNFTSTSQRITTEWGQSTNNGGGCDPSFNEYNNSSNNCNCGRKLVGCGNVAMAQIMNFWEFPNRSSHRDYDWSAMEDELFDGMDNSIPRLMRDCFNSTFSIPICSWLPNLIASGTATTINSIATAFNDNFKFKAAKKIEKATFTNEEWNEMITYIVSHHPLIYRADGDNNSKHTFIIDDYNSSTDEFFINWGWRGNNDDWTDLDNLNPAGSNGPYYKNEMVVLGLTPSCSQIPYDINGLSYTTVSGIIKNEQARNNVSIENITVKNNGKLILGYGNKIVINSGFKVEAGSSFEIKRYTNCNGYTNDDITITMATMCSKNSSTPYKALVQNGKYVVATIVDGAGRELKSFFAPVVNNEADLFNSSDIQNFAQAYYTLRYYVFNYYGTKHEGSKKILIM